MYNLAKMRLLQIWETMNQYSLSYVFDHTIFVNRVAIPVEKDLASLQPGRADQHQTDGEIVEITPELIASQRLVYPLRNRHLKALYYLEKGFGGYALVKGDKVSGDIWYFPLAKEHDKVHSDVKWLGITYGENDVYTFDMYLDQRERGKNAAMVLQKGALQGLHEKGYSKAYGYFWANNVPALWVHRILKWKELPRVKVSRFLFLKKVQR